MKTLYTGSLIWLKTVFLNSVLFGIMGIFDGNWSALFGSFIFLIIGFVGTLPLLLIIVPLVKISSAIPYSNKARIAWLCFYLVVLILLFYVAIAALDGGIFHTNAVLYQLLGTTIAGLFIAVLTTHRSLNKLYNSNT